MTRLPDESIIFQNTTGDAGMENLYIYGKLNYNFENDDITSKSINAGSGQFNNISLNTINATSHITTTATITALDLTATNNVSVGSSVTAGSFYGHGSNLTGIEAFVKGMIILWYGNTNNVPTGFALCDGTNDTPDLRDKFVVGAGSAYTPGDTGGSANATLVSHSHTTNSTIEESSSSAKSLTGSVRRIGEGYRAQGFTTGIFTKVNDGNNNITGSCSNSPVAGVTFDGTSLAETAAHMTCRMIFHPERANRQVEYHSRDSNQPGLEKVLERVIKETIYSKAKDNHNREIKRAVDHVILDHLISLSNNKASSPSTQSIVLGNIQSLRFELGRKKTNSEKDEYHSNLLKRKIDIYLNDPKNYQAIEVPKAPPGSPIGIEIGCTLEYGIPIH